MSKYTRKGNQPQALTSPDEFVSFWSRAYDALAPRWRQLGYAAIAVAVAIAGGWTFSYLAAHSREQATELFGRATAIAEAELITDALPVKSEDKIPRYKTDQERAGAALAELEKLDKDFSSSRVAQRSLLARAGLLFRLGRLPEAEAAWKKFLDAAPADDSMRFVASEGMALCAEGQNRLDDALAIYRQLEPKSGDFFRDRALWGQARLLTKKGDKKGAGQKYQELITRLAESPLRDDAQNRLGLLGFTVEKAAAPALPPGPGGG